jgi:hypothetical protein
MIIRFYCLITWLVAINICLAHFYNEQTEIARISKYFDVYVILKVDCEPRDQLRPGSFLHKREEPGNEVVVPIECIIRGLYLFIYSGQQTKYWALLLHKTVSKLPTWIWLTILNLNALCITTLSSLKIINDYSPKWSTCRGR